MFRIICVIPARGGSKSCPRKNIREVCGQPLISYPILAALRTPEIERVYVSTDDKETVEIAEKYGADVPFLRPKEFARDNSPDIEWATHFLGWFKEDKGYLPEYIVHLRATTPMIEPEKISEAIQKIQKYPECTSLVSSEEYTDSPFKALLVDGLYYDGMLSIKHMLRPKQSFPIAYHPNGYVDILKVDTLLQGKMHGDKILTFITERVIEVDSEYEFNLLEKVYGNG